MVPTASGQEFRSDDFRNGVRPHFWIAIYGLSGFLALSLEIVWFRLLGVMVKSTAFTFGTLLSVYLSGPGPGGARRQPSMQLGFVVRLSCFWRLQTAVGCIGGRPLRGLHRGVRRCAVGPGIFRKLRPAECARKRGPGPRTHRTSVRRDGSSRCCALAVRLSCTLVSRHC